MPLYCGNGNLQSRDSSCTNAPSKSNGFIGNSSSRFNPMVGNGRIIFKFRRVLVQGAAYARESLDPIILQKTNAINYITKTGLFGAILCPDIEQQKHPISLFKKKKITLQKKNTPFLNVPPFIFQQILTCSDTEINKKVSKQ